MIGQQMRDTLFGAQDPAFLQRAVDKPQRSRRRCFGDILHRWNEGVLLMPEFTQARGLRRDHHDTRLVLSPHLPQAVEHHAKLPAEKLLRGEQGFEVGVAGLNAGLPHMKGGAVFQFFDQRVPGDVRQGIVRRKQVGSQLLFAIFDSAFFNTGYRVAQFGPILHHDQGVIRRIVQQADRLWVKIGQIVFHVRKRGSVEQRFQVRVRAGRVLIGSRQRIEPGLKVTGDRWHERGQGFAGGRDDGHRQVPPGALRRQVKGAKLVDFIVKIVNANRHIRSHRENIDQPTPAAEGSRLHHSGYGHIAQADTLFQQAVNWMARTASKSYRFTAEQIHGQGALHERAR